MSGEMTVATTERSAYDEGSFCSGDRGRGEGADSAATARERATVGKDERGADAGALRRNDGDGGGDDVSASAIHRTARRSAREEGGHHGRKAVSPQFAVGRELNYS